MKKVNLMGLRLDAVIIDNFREEIRNYISNEYLNVILFASEEMIENASKDTGYKEILEEADYLLPGKNELLYISQEVEQDNEIFVDYHHFSQMVKDFKIENMKEVLTIYFVGRKEKRVENFIEKAKANYPNLSIQNTYYQGAEENGDLLVNEINGIAPDILILMLESPLQEKWIMKNSTKLNAKLCIGIGGILKEIEREEKQVPRIFQLLHINKAYSNWDKKKKRSIRIFQKKVAHYNKKQNHS